MGHTTVELVGHGGSFVLLDLDRVWNYTLKQKNMIFSETRFAIVAKIEVLVSSKDSEMDCQV